MATYYDEFIQSVHEDIGESADYSTEFLANWFAGNSNVGKLNNLIDGCFSGSYATGQYGEIVSYDIVPDLNSEQMAIYKKIFEVDFYNKQARYSLSGVGGALGGNDWTSLKEGDSSITRMNRNEVAKTFKSMAKDSREELDKMIINYIKYNSGPQQVVGDDTVAGTYYRGVSSDYNDYRSDRDYIY